MLYMIIEHFRDGDAAPVYRRLEETGRQTPAGVEYLSSWVADDLTRCYQVMRCTDRGSLDEWMSRWEDLVRFEVTPVITSAEARVKISEPS